MRTTRRPLAALALAAALLLPALPARAENWVDAFPFFPSLINSASGQPVASSEFFRPSKCRGCHPDIYEEWKGSMHSNAIHDPVFQALWKRASDETKGEAERLCAGCHTAVGTLAGEVTRDAEGNFKMTEVAAEGVHCHLCHSVTGTSRDSTPTLLPQNASLVVDPSMTMRGPYADAKPMWHEAAYSELHTTAEFCGNCHNVFHPANHFHIENTYTEWKFSIYAQKGIVCQDCHMMPVEKAIETARTLTRPANPGKASPMGPDRANVFTHEFVGGNVVIPRLLGSERHAAVAEARLKSAATLDVSASETEAAVGDLVRLAVRVTNTGAGHNLPTSLTEVRQMWLAVTVTDATGREVYRSGFLDADGNLWKGTVLFGAEALDAEGHHTVKPWEIERFAYNETIPAKGWADREYAFLVPTGVKGPLTAAVKLRYRSYPQSVAKFLLGDAAPVLPITDMAEAKAEIAVR